jgi:hypothetical protein
VALRPKWPSLFLGAIRPIRFLGRSVNMKLAAGNIAASLLHPTGWAMKWSAPRRLPSHPSPASSAGTAEAGKHLFRKRPFRFPAAIKPGVNCSLGNPNATRPIGYAHRFIAQRHAPIASNCRPGQMFPWANMGKVPPANMANLEPSATCNL